MHSNNILNIGAVAAHDNSIIKKEYYTYTPYTNSFAESEEIRIAINNQDLCLLPCESYLYIQVALKTINAPTSTSTNEKEKLKFVRNFASFLFNNARYELNGVEIDRIKNVGITSTLKLCAASSSSNTIGYHNLSTSFSWKVAETANDVLYDVMIPLKIWFGFCEDYNKVILNSRHELILQRARDDQRCFHANGKPDVKISVTIPKIEWKMPYVVLADSVKMDMNKFLLKNKILPIQHRSWDLYEYPELPTTTHHIWTVKTMTNLNKPRYVLVAFQLRRNELYANGSHFDGANMKSIRLYLNSQVYPYSMHDLDISHAKYAELYEAYANIQSSYYNGVENINQFALSYGEFQKSPMFAFDVSRSDESIKHGPVDIRLEITAIANLEAKTKAFCLIIYDNEFVYSPLNRTVEKVV